MLTTIIISVLAWISLYWFAITIASYDRDIEIYCIDFSSKLFVLGTAPLFILYYIVSFMGNLAGKAYNWSK